MVGNHAGVWWLGSGQYEDTLASPAYPTKHPFWMQSSVQFVDNFNFSPHFSNPHLKLVSAEWVVEAWICLLCIRLEIKSMKSISQLVKLVNGLLWACTSASTYTNSPRNLRPTARKNPPPLWFLCLSHPDFCHRLKAWGSILADFSPSCCWCWAGRPADPHWQAGRGLQQKYAGQSELVSRSRCKSNFSEAFDKIFLHPVKWRLWGGAHHPPSQLSPFQP